MTVEVATGEHAVDVRVFGATELRIGGRIVDVPRQQVRRLLEAFVVRSNDVVHVDTLTLHLWPGAIPDNPRKALNVVLSRFRAALGEQSDRLSAVGGGYRLLVDRVDIDEFASRIDQSSGGVDPDTEAQMLEAALTLWRGSPFPDAVDRDDIDQLRTSLHERRWFAITRLTELWSAAGDHARAVTFSAPFVADQPFRERLVAAHAIALARDGRKADALRTLVDAIAHLRDDLGLDPSPVMLETERSILSGAVDLVRSGPTLVRPSADLFVGRVDELNRLTSVRLGQSVVVVGEAGIGKSSLVSEAMTQLRAAGDTVIDVTVNSAPERPLDGVAQLCVLLARQHKRAAEEHAATLSRLCPELSLGRAEVSLTRDAMLTDATLFIEQAAAGSVISIDDAQWLDAGSIEVVRSLVSHGACRLIVSMRPSDDPKLSFLLDGVAGTEVIRLVPLSEVDVDVLADAARPGRSEKTLARDIVRRTGGNALFIRLLLDRWSEGASLDDDLPTTVLVTVRERLDVLAQRNVDTLQAAAVIGRSFGLHTLRQIRSNAEGDLDAARSAGLMRVDPVTDRAEFIHQLVADACYELLPEGRRIVLHDEIGRILEADRAPAPEVSRHFVIAAEIDPERAVRSTLSAAAEFAVGYDWQSARYQLDTADRLVAQYQISNIEMVAEMTVRRGIVARALLDDGHVDLLVAGAKLAREAGDDQLFAIAVTELCDHGRSLSASFLDDQLVALLDEALELDLPPDHRAELCATASVLFSHTNETTRGRALYREALHLIEELDDPEIEAAVYMQASLGLTHPDDFELLRAAALRLTELSGSDPAMSWEAAFLRFGTSGALGEMTEVRDAIDELRRLTPLVTQRSRDFGMAFCEAAYASLRGDFETAEKFANEALHLGLARFTESWAMNVYSIILIGVRHMQGRLDELQGIADDLLDASPDYLPYRMAAAFTSFAAGDVERASLEFALVARDGFSDVPRDASWLSFAALLAPVAVAVGTSVDVETLWSELVKFEGRMTWNGVSTVGPVDDALAVLAQARGDAAGASMYRKHAASLMSRLAQSAE